MPSLITLLTAAVEGDRLNCDTIDTKPVDYDWDNDWDTERWDTVVPSFNEATAGECAEWLSDRGSDVPTEEYDATIGEVDYTVTRKGNTITVEPALPGLTAFAWNEDTLSADGAVGIPTEITDAVEAGNDDYLETLRETCNEEAGDDTDGYAPMMSYYYPLPGYHGDEADDQRKLALACLPVALARINVGGDPEVVLVLTGGGMDLTWGIVTAYLLLGYRPPLHFCRPPRMAGWERDVEKRWLLKACRESARIAASWAQCAIDDCDRMLAEMLPEPPDQALLDAMLPPIDRITNGGAP